MTKEQAKVLQLPGPAATIEGVRVGTIVRAEEGGVVFVDFPGNASGPLAARTTTSSHAKVFSMEQPAGQQVLLAFEENDPQLAVIVDTMNSPADSYGKPATLTVEAEEPQELTVDGKWIAFHAQDEIVLQCGKSSITLTKAGKILIKGEYLLSEALGENRIRGGSIAIN